MTDRPHNLTVTLLSMLLALAASTGCAQLDPSHLVGNDGRTIKQRQLRQQEAGERFAQARTQGEYQAAVSQWESGDEIGCEMTLLRLLERNPNFHEARRLLADLRLQQGDTAAATRELNTLLAADPNDAQTHHSLGLLYESLGQPAAAAKHIDQACRLEPNNQLYAMSR